MLSDLQEMEMKSKLRVKVKLPNGDSFFAFQCMNFLPSGTMYRTDNRKWMFHANGFTCRVYRELDDRSGYSLYYEGVLARTVEKPKR